jgi:branched-chain amino acid transport system permease protein
LTKRISIISVIIVVIIIGLLMGRYFAHLLTTMFIGAIMALGLNFFFGYCGQINFGTAAFVAIGAYSSLLLQREFGFPFPIAAIAALLITAIVVLIISYPLLRLKGHGMAFGTLAIGLLVYYLLFAARGITGGENGLYAESWSIFGYEPGMLFYYFLSFGCMLMCFTICHLLINSRIGRAI